MIMNFNMVLKSYLNIILKALSENTDPEAKFKEFKPRLKFKPWLKYGWFALKIVLNLSRFKSALN